MITKRFEGDFLDSNIFVVEDKNDCIIIDAGVDLNKFEDYLNGKNVLGIFLTHGHYDHSFFAIDYAKKYGCKIYGSQFLKEYLSNPDYNYSEGKFKVEDFSLFQFLGDCGELKLGNLKVFYKQLGGHSKSDMVFMLNDEIFVGDLLLGRDMGRIDLYGGSKADMKNALEYLLNQNYEIMHSGHGEDRKKIEQDKVIKLWLRFLNR